MQVKLGQVVNIAELVLQTPFCPCEHLFEPPASTNVNNNKFWSGVDFVE